MPFTTTITDVVKKMTLSFRSAAYQEAAAAVTKQAANPFQATGFEFKSMHKQDTFVFWFNAFPARTDHRYPKGVPFLTPNAAHAHQFSHQDDRTDPLPASLGVGFSRYAGDQIRENVRNALQQAIPGKVKSDPIDTDAVDEYGDIAFRLYPAEAIMTKEILAKSLQVLQEQGALTSEHVREAAKHMGIPVPEMGPDMPDEQRKNLLDEFGPLGGKESVIKRMAFEAS